VEFGAICVPLGALRLTQVGVLSTMTFRQKGGSQVEK
jgi:hypothetical protein